MKFERASILALALSFGALPLMAQQQTTQESTRTTTVTTSATASAPIEPETHHQLKKDERANADQAKADHAEAKAVRSKKVRKAEKKQDEADRAAARANSPY